MCISGGCLIALKGCASDAGVHGCIVGTDELLKQYIKFLQGMDLLHIQTIEPGFLASAPEPLDLGLGCAIPNLGMKEYCTDGTADERELFIDIGRTIVRAIPNSE